MIKDREDLPLNVMKMKKKKIALAKKLMLNKTTVNTLSEQKNQSEGRISYHTFINCDEEARRNGYFC